MKNKNFFNVGISKFKKILKDLVLEKLLVVSSYD